MEFTGTNTFKEFRKNLSGGYNMNQYLIFHGIPDVLVSKTKQITIATSFECETEELSEEECVMEACFQRNLLKSSPCHPNMPQKLEELILHYTF